MTKDDHTIVLTGYVPPELCERLKGLGFVVPEIWDESGDNCVVVPETHQVIRSQYRKRHRKVVHVGVYNGAGELIFRTDHVKGQTNILFGNSIEGHGPWRGNTVDLL